MSISTAFPFSLCPSSVAFYRDQFWGRHQNCSLSIAIYLSIMEKKRRLQSILKAAARLVFRLPGWSSITELTMLIHVLSDDYEFESKGSKDIQRTIHCLISGKGKRPTLA